MNRAQPAVGIISNRNSGHNRDQFAQVAAVLDACPGAIHCVTNSVTEVPAALRKIAAVQPQLLVINGGDGTASTILGELLESGLFPEPPLIALLPGGTANMNAGDIGVPGKLLQSAQRIRSWLEGERDLHDRVAYRSLLRVCKTSNGSVHYGMFVGAGAIMQGTEYAHREIHSRGLRDDFSLALGTLRTVWGVVRDDPRFNQHVTVGVELDETGVTRFDTLILAISTLQRLAFGMQPFWGRSEGAIRITLMEQHCSQFLRTFVSIVRGKPNRNARPESGYHSYNANCLRLVLDGSLNIDGEIIETNGEVAITPTVALGFLRP